MIDRDRTLSVLGVDVSTLTSGSHKMIFRVCEGCGRYDIVRYGSHRWTHCVLCANSDPDRCLRVSESLKAKWKKEDHPLKGRHLSEERKEALHIMFSGENNPMYGRTGELAPGFGQCGEKNSMFGKHHSEETKKKISRKGPEHPNWRGGITSYRNRLYRSHAYQAWRQAVFERDHFTCQMCGDDTGGNLQAHHIKPIREHKNDLLIFNIDNGITLCKDCHKPTIRREADYEAIFYAIIKGVI